VRRKSGGKKTWRPVRETAGLEREEKFQAAFVGPGSAGQEIDDFEGDSEASSPARDFASGRSRLPSGA